MVLTTVKNEEPLSTDLPLGRPFVEVLNPLEHKLITRVARITYIYHDFTRERSTPKFVKDIGTLQDQSRGDNRTGRVNALYRRHKITILSILEEQLLVDVTSNNSVRYTASNAEAGFVHIPYIFICNAEIMLNLAEIVKVLADKLKVVRILPRTGEALLFSLFVLRVPAKETAHPQRAEGGDGGTKLLREGKDVFYSLTNIRHTDLHIDRVHIVDIRAKGLLLGCSEPCIGAGAFSS